MTDAAAGPALLPGLIDAKSLSQALARPIPPLLLDVRFTLGGAPGYPEYLAGHLPGAHYLDLPNELSTTVTNLSVEGRRPLPPVEQLQHTLRRLGLNRPDQPVVLYDDRKNLSAARGWWVLKWAGLANVRLLDGGLTAWKQAGFPLQSGLPPVPAEGDIQLKPDQLPRLTADQVQPLARGGVLIDARSPDAYRGSTQAKDEPRSGHIPAAINLPAAGDVTADGFFLSADQLRSRFCAAGVTGNKPVGVYCGGGVAATHIIFALHALGIPAALYVGSWSAWSQDPDRPAVQGDLPG